MAWRLFANISVPDDRQRVSWTTWSQAHEIAHENCTAFLAKSYKESRPEEDSVGPYPNTQNLLLALQTLKGRKLNDTLNEILHPPPASQPHIAVPTDFRAYYSPVLVKTIRASQLNCEKGRVLRYGGSAIDLKESAIAIKVARGAIQPRDASNYFTTSEDYGVIAFHLTARKLPQWIWATWEHDSEAEHDKAPVDKGGRGLHLKDSFGCDARGCPSKALEDLMKALKVPEVLWRHYRLIGTQIYSTDGRGDKIPLGNPQIEQGPLDKMSCINCHAQAAFDCKGVGTEFLTRVGPPDPKFFTSPHLVKADRGPCAGKPSMQLDFLWALVSTQEVKELADEKQVDLESLEERIQ
jgi:hypothetical protein